MRSGARQVTRSTDVTALWNTGAGTLRGTAPGNVGSDPAVLRCTTVAVLQLGDSVAAAISNPDIAPLAVIQLDRKHSMYWFAPPGTPPPTIWRNVRRFKIGEVPPPPSFSMMREWGTVWPMNGCA